MKKKRYQEIQYMLKEKIQQGTFEVGDYLPSENELCTNFNITRTTVRKALDELLREGFIEKQHGKGSRVRERRLSLGLLNVKGFSEVVGRPVRTIFLQDPNFRMWNLNLPFVPSFDERKAECIHFERLRCANDEPVMLENNWFSGAEVPDFVDQNFIEGSFFKTLSQRYLLEITGSEQELRALLADEKIALQLRMKVGSPVLQISIKFSTSNPNFHIYSQLYCNTANYPIENSYFL